MADRQEWERFFNQAEATVQPRKDWEAFFNQGVEPTTAAKPKALESILSKYAVPVGTLPTPSPPDPQADRASPYGLTDLITGIEKPQKAEELDEIQSPLIRLPLAGAQGVNRAVATLFGGPVDLTNWALGLVGAGGDKPVMGSDWLREKLLPKPSIEERGIAEKLIGRVGEEIGYSVLPTFGMFGKLSRTIGALKGGKKSSGMINYLVDQMAEIPLPELMKFETMAIAGGGAGGFAMEETFPDNPTAAMLGQLGGAIGPVAAVGVIRAARQRATGMARVKPPVEPGAKPKPDVLEVLDTDQGIIGKGETGGLVGKEATLKTVNRDVPAQYKVVEMDDLVPSHDPHTFAENPKYPVGVQERDYFRDKSAQAAVIENSRKYDPSFTITDAPGPEHGPPMVTKDGIVVGGNSRAMSTARLYKAGEGDLYKNTLIREADRYGIGPNEVKELKNPILVREIQETPKTTAELAVLGSDLNRVFTRGLSQQEQAVSAGKRIGQDTLDFVGGQLSELAEGASIRDLLRARPKAILDRLRADKIISAQELRKFVDEKTGAFNEAGRDFIENALLGSVIDDAPLLAVAPKAVTNKVARSLAPIAQLKARGEQWDISRNIKDALRAYTGAAARGESIDDYIDPNVMKLFGDEVMDPITLGIIQKLKGTSKNIKQAFQGLADDATIDVKDQRGLGFFEAPSPKQSFKEHLGVDLPTPKEAAPGGEVAAYVSKRGPKPPEKPAPAPEPSIPGSARAVTPDEPILAEVDRILWPEKTPEQTVLERLKQAPEKAWHGFQARIINKFRPLGVAERELYKVAGKEAPVLDLAAEFAQVAGAVGKGTDDVLRFTDRIMKPLAEIDSVKDFERFLFLKRTEDRLLGETYRKRVANWSLAKSEGGLDELQVKVGSDKFQRLEEIGDIFQAEMNRSLRLQVDSGRMSEGLYSAIKKGNNFYAPFKLLKYLETGEAVGGAGRRMATTADLTRMITGIDAEDFTLSSILEESAKQIYRSRLLAEKNFKMLMMDDLAGLDEAGKFMKKVRPERYYEIHHKPAEEVLHQLHMQETARKPQLLEVSLTKVGKALEVAQGAGLHVTKRNMLTALGRAQLGGADFDGRVFLDAFTSEVITHELAHSFDTAIVDASGNIVTKLKNVFGVDRDVIQRLSSAINDREVHKLVAGKKLGFGKRTVYQDELKALMDYTGIGGTPAYRAKAVERFAEFVQLYIHDPKEAKILAPEFSKFFETKILPNNKIQSLVKKLSNFYQKIDGLPNIHSPLKEMDDHNYLELAIRTAFPEEKPHLGVVFGEKARPGYEIVNYYKEGNVQALEVRKDLAKAIQGMTKGEATQVAKWLQISGGVLKMGATAFNIAFQPVNLIFADLPRAAFVSRYGVKNHKDLVNFPLEWVYCLGTAFKGNFGKPNELYRFFLESGAANTTLARLFAPGAFNVSVMGPQTLAQKFKVNFLDTAPKFANSIEEASKILGIGRGFRMEKIAKLPPDEAVLKIRELVAEVRNYSGSPDFLRSGSWSDAQTVENLNLLLMFFNPAVQGVSADLARMGGQAGLKPFGLKPRALASLKDAAPAWGRLAGFVGVPALALKLHNMSERPVVMDGPRGEIVTTNRAEYNKVPDWERHNYHMIPHFDNSYFINHQGEVVRNYHKTPKREIIQLMSNLIESFVDFAIEREPGAVKEFTWDFLENISPVSIEGETWGEMAESVLSTVNPMMKTPIELGLGRDTFRHRDIVPQYIEGVPSREIPSEEQYTSRTPGVFKALGKTPPAKYFGASPLEIEHATRGMTAGLLTQFLPGQVSPGRPTVLSAPVAGSVARRFQRSDYTYEDPGKLAPVREALLAQGGANVQLQREAEDMYTSWRELSSEEKLEEYRQIKTDNPRLAKRIMNLVDDDARGLDREQRIMKRLQVVNGARAKFIVSKLAEIEDSEERFRYWLDLKQKKLISEQVGLQIQALGRMQQGK